MVYGGAPAVIRTLLIGNPTAQSGRNAERIARARALLDEHGVQHRFEATRPAGGTVDLVRRALDDESLATVVYMGGDDHIRRGVKGILASPRAAAVRLGMLPTGTANDQGRSFGLGSTDADLERNVRVVAAGHETLLDAGRIRTFAPHTPLADDWFFDSAGWGISPRVLRVRNEDRQAISAIPLVRDVYRDQLVYAGALLRTFIASYVEDGKFDAILIADGQRCELRGRCDLVVKGTRVYGGLWVLDPASRHDDGRFEVVPFPRQARLGLQGHRSPRRQWHGRRHTLDPGRHPFARHQRLAHRARLPKSSPACPSPRRSTARSFSAALHVEIDVVPRALRLIVPEDADLIHRHW